ncbi:alpha/beta hydrolase fold family protein [Ehrlichia chaffeensis str. Heartland]|nr:alpha/beta fold hydrolase [Ehrlichia chaffeensis]AHX03356.1 alpha/beta hydrolase fold family protein [Ehrlichia chaffeensis str. Heartland]AHX06915.1 alpha/beta hydrolase fold family protein [Ehrlichia chaffeensis str. Liberty]AHX07123.1 alpha/beta hydrolase fold family protein [Ehrlichia chaffeensis str. Osceola]AHX08955.1 alpha/beta hydrolase fold family protein [Ehrlichia chaffeensis str. Saint Vincent]AHX09054.1 alpha/beta hydrolase fold family protein [Ehrlichia chaffeensis str. Wakull
MHYNYTNSPSSNYLICVHGITRNSRDFDYLANILSSDYKIICPDIVGRGKSSWLEDYSLYNYLTYCKSIIYLLKHLKIDKVDFLGTSMGGIIGMYLAAYFPNLINKLIINDIGPAIKVSALEKISKHININPIFNTITEAEIYIKKLLCNFSIDQEDHWQHIIKHSIIQNPNKTYSLAVDPKIGIAFNKEINCIKDTDAWTIWDIWEKIQSRILVIRGSLSNILTKTTLNKMLLSKQYIDFIEYPNIGHAPALMSNNQIQDIRNWLLS